MLCGAPASHGPGSGVSVAHGPGAREIPGTEPEPFHKKEKWGTGQTLGRRKIPEITRSISKLSERRDVGRGLGILRITADLEPCFSQSNYLLIVSGENAVV